MTDTSSQVAALQSITDDLLRLSDDTFHGSNIPQELHKKFLLGVLLKAGEYVSAISNLCDGGHSGPISALSRSMMEGYFIAHYVLAEDASRRAASYVGKASRGNRSFFNRILRVARTNPPEGQEFLDMLAVGTREDLERKIAEMDLDHADGRFPSIEDCARALGPKFELMYAQVYGHLLSDEVHFGPLTTLRYVWRTDDADQRIKHCERVLLSVADMYQDLLHLAAANLECPDVSLLEPFVQRIAEIRQEVLRNQ